MKPCMLLPSSSEHFQLEGVQICFLFLKYIFDPHNFLSAGDISMKFLIPVWESVSWMCQILTDVISVA